MGSICSKDPNLIPKPSLQQLEIRSADQIPLSPGVFIQENTQNFFSKYRLHSNPIGSGLYGEIRLCEHIRTHDIRAVKIITKAGLAQEVIDSRSVLNEVDIMKTLDHPNILRIFEYFEDHSNYYIVMEYCKGGDLFDKVVSLTKFTEKQAALIMEQIFSGLNYSHNRGVVHRDMKPENVVIMDTSSDDDLAIKIIDFDTATFFNVNSHLKGSYGTPLYMAPEVIKGKHNEKCDLWSCGVILYILLSGNAPFEGVEDSEIIRSIEKSDISLTGDNWNSISDDAKDLISKLLKKNVHKRLSASQAYSHPWIQKYHKDLTSEDPIISTLSSIKSFRASNKLKYAIKTFILCQVMSPHELESLQKAFNAIDTNGDGVISKIELYNQLKLTMSEDEAKAESERILQNVDTDLNGVIDYTEFLHATVEKKKMLTKTNLHKAFMMFDNDESGVIEVNEVRRWLVGDAKIDENVVKELIQELDKNSDGCIDLQEFEVLIYSHSKDQTD